MTDNNNNWVARFLNLPPKDQIHFLYRNFLEEAMRKEIEGKLLDQKKD